MTNAARYRRMAERAVAALPNGRRARAGRPTVFVTIECDTSRRGAAADAIKLLAAAISEHKARRYCSLGLPSAVDYAINIDGPRGQRLRLVRQFVPRHGRMATFLDVALA